MRRAEIRLVTLDSIPGAETARTRPAVIVSNDGANATAARLNRGMVTVVPITRNVSRVFPFQVLLKAADCGLDRDAKAQAEQVRSVSVARIGRKVGQGPPGLMVRIDNALKLHLAL